ncbi:MAG: nickel pincer cofactor biosynthesis protein LarC [Lachnospiraceae bacterium]|nr:nickel pincer cofactor biosynthesis protein LarC [Lachnospiraceae bacterium]
MGETLYLECNSGISGDMTVAALLDLGADRAVLDKAIQSLPQEGFRVKISRVKKAGVDCSDFDVQLDAHHENHDHDMEYLHGDSVHEHSHGHHHEDNGHHEHHHHSHGEEGHHHHHEDHHHHGHSHRGLPEIISILDACDMTEAARQLAKKIFQILAESEAKAHAVPLEEVHFHEVGAIDSIVDIVAAAVCLDNLQITSVIVPKLCEGSGTVRCQHGILPVPVPAVANILEKYQIPVEIMPVRGEFVTPTGAAIVAAVQTDVVLPDAMRIKKIGMGAGKRNYERPSILRAMLLQCDSGAEKKTGQEPATGYVPKDGQENMIYKLESNIDDSTGEELGYVMELLMEAGARDVHYMPTFMKKNRPAYQINVICMPEDVEKLEQIIFRNTTTIGIRRMKMERSVLERESKKVTLPYGEVVVKCCMLDGEKHFYPEYDSVTTLCKAKEKPYREIYREAVLAAKKQLG